MTININIPRSWQELTQQQLLYVYLLMAAECYNLDEIKTMCFVRFGNLIVEKSDNPDEQDKFVFIDKSKKKVSKFTVKARQVAECLYHLDWLGTFPDTPVRLATISTGADTFEACEADLSDLEFADYIALENLFTGYLHTKRNDLLLQIFLILYKHTGAQTPGLEFAMKLPDEIRALMEFNVLMWVTSFKQYAQREFPELFTTTTGDAVDGKTLKQRLTDSANSMILTLTNGDITREQAVLQQDTWRALTYLNHLTKTAETI